eukprot:Seg3196.2 transcript_id=Seg3196.2/GoldUCD/mRNA.D3Y31 product="hypothetical protein" protein_id=Seg3196.2/GoldUCD/D3Y31
MLGHQLTRSPNLEVSFKLPRAAAKDLWHLAKCGDTRLKDIGILKVQIRELRNVNPDEFLSWNGRRKDEHQRRFEDWSYNSLRNNNERNGIQNQHAEEFADYRDDIPAQWPRQHAPPHYTLYNSSQPPSQTLRGKNEYRRRSGHVADKEVHKTKIIGISRGVLTNESIPIVADFLGPTPGWLLESALCISFRRHGKCEVACQTGSEKIVYRPRPGSSRYEQSSRMEMAAAELLSDIDGRYKVYSDKITSEKELCDELRPRKSTSKDGSFTQCSSESIRILESLANSLENANEKAGTGISGEYPTNQMYEQNIRVPVFYEGQNDVVSRQPRGGNNLDQRYGSGMQVNLNAEIGHMERPVQYAEEEGLLLNIEKKNVALHYVSENRGGRVNSYSASQAAEYRQGNSRQERDAMIERSDIREGDSFREETKDPAQVFGSGTLRDYLEREKEIYEASKKDFAIAAEKHQLQDYEFRRFLKIDPAKRPSVHKSCMDDSFKKMFSEDHEPKVRDIDSNQIDNSEHSSNQMGYSGQSLPISVSLDGDYLKGIAARGKEGKDGTKRKRTRRVPSSSQDYVGEDEYLDDETYLPYQVKRKRGRPPKTGVPVEQPKKKRGRPPKIKPLLTDAAEVPLDTGGPGIDARRIGDYISSADLRRMSSVSTDSQDLDGSSLGQGLTENGECLLQEAQRNRAAPKISYQGEVFDDKREYFVEEAKQDERSSRLPVTIDLPTRANTDDLFVLDTAPAAQTKSAENQAITDRSMKQVISDEDVIELSSNEDHSAFSPVHMKGSNVPRMISPAAAMTAEENHENTFFRDQAKPIHVDTSEKGYGDQIIKTNITHSEEYRRGSENLLASHVEASFRKTKEFPKEILSAPHLTPGTSRSSSPIDRTYQIDLDMKVRSRRHRWYQKDTVHRDIEEAYTRMYPSVACETEQLMPEDVYYGENYPIIFADDDKVMMKFVDMSTAFKLAMKESATKKQRSSSTELVVPTVSQKEGKKTSERRRSSVQSLTDIHESEDTKIEASVVAKMQKRHAVVIKKTSKPNPPAKRKSIEADSDSDFVTDKRRETHILDAESSEKPSHGMSLRPRRVLNLGEEYLSSDSFEEEYGPDADTASVYESDESSDSEPLINKVRKSSTSSATKFVRRRLSEKVDALSGESLKTFVDNAARQTTQHIETVLGNMPTGMSAKTSSESFARSLGPTGLSSKTSSGNFRKNLGPHSYVSHNLMQAVGSNTTLKENNGNALGQGRSISHNLPQAGASKQSLTHVPSTKLPGLSQSTQIRSREVKSSQRVELDETEQRSAETAVMTTPSNRDTFVISFDDLMASEAFSMCKEKRENEDSPQNDLAKASTEKSDGDILYDSARDMIAKHKREVIVDLTSDCSMENLSPVDKKEIVPKGDSGLKRDYLLETSSTLKTEEDTNEALEERRAIHLKQGERLSKGDSGLKRDYLMKTSSTLKTGENTNEVSEERRAIYVKEEEHSALSVIKSDEIVVSQESLSNSSETFVVDMLGDEKEYAVKSRTEASKVMCEEIKLTNDPSSVYHERVTSELKALGEVENHQRTFISKSHNGKQKLVEDSGSKETVNVTVGDGLQGKAMKRNSQKDDDTREDLPEVTSQSQGEKHKLKEGPGVPKKDVVTGDVLQGEAKKGRSQAATVTSKDRPEATPKSQGDKHKLEEDPGVSKKDVVIGDVLLREAKKERSQAVTVTSKDRPEVTPQSQDEKHRLEKGPDVPKKDVIVVVEDILQGEAKKGKNQKGTAAGKEGSVFVEEEGSRKADEKVKEDSSYIASVKSENVCQTGSRIMTEKSEANSFEKSDDETVFQQTEELIRESANSDTSVIKDTSMLEDASLFEDTSVIKDPSMFKDTSLFEDKSVIKDTSVVKDTAVGNATVAEKKPTEERNSMQHVSKDCAVGTIKVAETITSKEVMAAAETITTKEVMAVAETITSKEMMDSQDTEVKRKSNTVENIKSKTTNDLSSKEITVIKDANSEAKDTETMLEKYDTEPFKNITDIASDQGTKGIMEESATMSSETKLKDGGGTTGRKQGESKIVAVLAAEPAAPKKQNNKNTEENGGSKITNLIKRSIKAISDTLIRAKVPKFETGSMIFQKAQVKREIEDENNLQESEEKKDVVESGDKGKQGSQREEDVMLASNLPKVETDSMDVPKTQLERGGEVAKSLQESEGNKEVAEAVGKGKKGSQKEETVMLATDFQSGDGVKKEVRYSGNAQRSRAMEETDSESSKLSTDDSKSSKMERAPEIVSATDYGSIGSKNAGDESLSKAAASYQLETKDEQKSILRLKNDAGKESRYSAEQITNTDIPLCLTSIAGGVNTDFKVPIDTATQKDGAYKRPLAADEAPKFDTIIDKPNAVQFIDGKGGEKKTSAYKVHRLEKFIGQRSDPELSVEECVFKDESSAQVSEMLIADKAASITESGVPCSRATANETNQCPVTIKGSEGSARSMKSATTNMPGKLTESGDTKKHERCDELERQGSNLAENNSSAADLVADTGNVVPKPLASKVSNAASMKSQVSARQGSISTPSKRNENSSRQAVPQGSGSSPFAKDPLGTSHSPSDERHAEETDAAQGLRPSPSAKRHIEEMDAAQCLLGLFNSDQPSQSPTKTSGGMSTNLQQGESSGQEKNTRNAQVAVQESKPEIAKGTKGSILLIASERKISSRLGSAHRDIDKRPKFQSVTTSVSLDKNKAVMDHDYIADYSTCEIQQAAKLSPNSRSVSDRSDSTKGTGMFMPQVDHQKGKNPSKNSENQAKGSGSSPVADQKSLPASQTARNIFESFKFEQPSESVVQNDNVEIVSSKRDRKRSSSHTGSVLESTTSGQNVGKEATAIDSRKKLKGTNSDKVEGQSSKTDADHRGQKVVVSKDNSKKLETAMADRCETKKRVVEEKSEKQEGTMSGKVEQQFDTDHSKVGGQKVVVSKDNSKKLETSMADRCETKKRVVEDKSEKHEYMMSCKVEQQFDTDHSKVGGQKVVVSKDSRMNPDILKADSCKTEKKVVKVKSENQEGTNSDVLEQRPSKVDTDHSEIRGQKLFVSEVSAYKPEIVNADSGQAKKRVAETKLDQNSSEDAAQSGPGNIFENMGISGISGEKKEHCRDSKEKANTDAGKGGEKDVIRETISGIAGDIAVKKRQVSSGNAREEEFEDCHVTESLSTNHVERKQERPANKVLHDSKLQSHEEGTKLNNDRKSSDFGHGAEKSGRTEISRSGQTSADRHKCGQTSVDADITLYTDERLDVMPDSQSQKAALRDEIVENADAGKVKGQGSETDKKGSDTVPLLVSDEVKDSDQHCNKKLEADACSFKVEEDVVCGEKLHDRASQLSETSKRIRRDLSQETASEKTDFAPSAKVSKQEFLDELLDNNKTTEPLEPSEKEGCTPDCTTRRAENEGQYCVETLEEISPVEQGSSSEKPDTCLASGPKHDPSEMMHEEQHKDKDFHQESDGAASNNKQRSGTSQGKGNSSNQESETKRRHREKKRKSADLELLDENRNAHPPKDYEVPDLSFHARNIDR